jgi:hypothetical protein
VPVGVEWKNGTALTSPTETPPETKIYDTGSLVRKESRNIRAELRKNFKPLIRHIVIKSTKVTPTGNGMAIEVPNDQ